jgi:hypothetical protein
MRFKFENVFLYALLFLIFYFLFFKLSDLKIRCNRKKGEKKQKGRILICERNTEKNGTYQNRKKKMKNEVV